MSQGTTTTCTPFATMFQGDHVKVMETLAYWADLVSLVVLATMMLVLPLPPTHRVWSRPIQAYGRGALLCIHTAWSIYRYFVEASLQIVVSRNFMDLATLYSLVWVFWYFGWTRKNSSVLSKMKRVVNALRELKTVRVGGSTFDIRRGQLEVVVRMGCPSPAWWPGVLEKSIIGYDTRIPPRVQAGVTIETVQAQEKWKLFPSLFGNVDKGIQYWRGIEVKKEQYFDKDENKEAWLVTLQQIELHHMELDGLLSMSSTMKDQDYMLETYKVIYNLVYTACRQHARHKYLGLNESTTRWFKGGKYKHLKPEYLAQQSGCDVDDTSGEDVTTPLGGIARRIAADACHYLFVSKSSCRIEEQIERLNDIVDAIANEVVSNHFAPSTKAE